MINEQNQSDQNTESIIRATRKIVNECNLLTTNDYVNDRKKLLMGKYQSFVFQFPVVSIAICTNMYNEKAFRMTLRKGRISKEEAQKNYFKYYFMSTIRNVSKDFLSKAREEGERAFTSFINSISYKSNADFDDIKDDIKSLVVNN